MATAKKKTPSSHSDGGSGEAFVVVLEDIRSQFRVFGESLQGLREHMDDRFEAVDRRFEAVDKRFDEVDRRFEAVDKRFDEVDKRFEAVDKRFDEVDKRFDRLEGRVGRGEGDLALVKTAVLENSRTLADHGRELREIRAVVTASAVRLDEKVSRVEVEDIVERAIAKQQR
jgi:chromosome segregation ATPase